MKQHVQQKTNTCNTAPHEAHRNPVAAISGGGGVALAETTTARLGGMKGKECKRRRRRREGCKRKGVAERCEG